jgi:hypothetical protein
MEESIQFCTSGTAGPYLIVPTAVYESLHEHFNQFKINRSAGQPMNDKDQDRIIEVPAYSSELEIAIDAWFANEKIEVEKNKEGDPESPTKIIWSYLQG